MGSKGVEASLKIRLYAFVLLLVLRAAPAVAQVASCTSADCSAASMNEVWESVQQVHERKQEFVVGIRDFSAALRGVFGDESPRVRSSLAATENALARWDEAIGTFAKQAARVKRSAEIHAALASVYLDRQRIDDALKEIAAAEALEPGRPDVHALRAVAFGIAGKPADAASAIAKVVALDSANLPAAYELWQYLVKAGETEKAEQALGVLARPAVWARAEPGASPFVRVALVRQVGGVAPIFPPGLYAQGFASLGKGAYGEAVAAFKQAVERDPLTSISTAAQTPLAQASADLRQGRLDAAITRLRGLAQSFPEQSQVHRILGLAYWVDEQHNAGIEQFKEAIRLSPIDERSWLALADMLVSIGRDDEAAKTLEQAVAALPDSGQARYSLGRLYQSLGRESDALIQFEKAASPGPIVGHDALWEIIGGLHNSHANFDASVAAHARRTDINPNSSDAHRRLGDAYALQGRMDEAIAELIVAAYLNANNAAAHASAAKVYGRVGRHTEVIASARRALELDPSLAEIRYVLATSLTRSGRTEEGARELQAFQQQQADAADATRRQFERDAMKRDIAASTGSGDYDKAVELLRGTISRDPKVVANYVELGGVLMKAGRYREAAESFETARQLGADASIYRSLAEAYGAMNRPEESRQFEAVYQEAVRRAKESRLRRLAGATN
jgi:tetratricopeptide (TPR) repeat protein